MDKDEVLALAKEAGFIEQDTGPDFTCWTEDIERFAALLAAKQQEPAEPELSMSMFGSVAELEAARAEIAARNKANQSPAPVQAQPVSERAIAWRMITPDSGNIVFLTDHKEAQRFKEMAGHEVRPLVFGDVA